MSDADRHSILIVDDQPENLLALEAVLEPLGQNVVRARSGAEALKRLLDGDFALILLDVQMPDLDGFETAAYIKRRERTRHIPIIFLTAIDKESHHVYRGYSAGAVDYLFKPYDPELLRSKVSIFVELHEKSSALKESERRFSSAFESAPIGMTIIDLDGRWRQVNRAFCRIVGVGERELLAQSYREITHPDDLDLSASHADRLVRGELPGYEIEKRYLRPDGKVVWARVAATLVRGAGGEPLYALTQVQDITEQREAQAAVLRSEGRYRTLIENLPDSFVVLLDLDLRCQVVEGPGIERAGWSKEQLEGKTIAQALPRQRAVALEADVRAAFAGETRSLEWSASRTGRRSSIEALPITDENDRISGAMLVGHDVTERRRAEAALRDAEQRFRSAFEIAPIGMALVDLDGHYLQVNRSLCLITGYDERALLDKTFQEVTHPADLDDDMRQVELLIDGEIGFYELEKRFIRADGSVVWCLLATSLVRDEAETPLYFLAQVQDISERKQAELHRVAQLEVTRVLAEATGLEEALPRLLRALGESLGWKAGVAWLLNDRALALRLAELWHADSLDGGPIDETSRRLSLGRGEDLPGLVWSTAETVWADDLPSLLTDGRAAAFAGAGLAGAVALPLSSGGKVLGVIELFRPVPAAHDPRVGELLATLGGQIGEFIERKRAEAEADRLKDEFFALVSHELRTPLTSIVGYLEVLREEDDRGDSDLSEHQRNVVSILERNAQRLLRLVGDLLFVAQVEAGKISIDPGPVDIAAVAAEAVEAARPHAETKGIELSLTGFLAEEGLGDRGRIGQAIDNLISNALKFTHEGGQVELRLSSSEPGFVLEVEDSGVGIPAGEQERLFERFFRASSATAHAVPGVGLGLTIVKSIVEAHGGRITVASAEGSGTTFRVELPLEPVLRPDDEPGRRRSRRKTEALR